MSSITSASSSLYTRPSPQDMFKKLDADGDGQLTKAEFVDGRPSDVSEAQASKLFDSIDSEGTGYLTESTFAQAAPPANGADGLSRLDSETMQTLLSALGAGESEQSATSPEDRLSELFAKLDTDGDGNVTKEEFVAGRPDDVSEEQAASLFDKIDSESTGSVDEEGFVSGMMAQGPMGPPPPPPMASGSDSDEDDDDTTTSSVTSTSDILEQMLKDLETARSENVDTNAILQQLVNALKSYASASASAYGSTTSAGNYSIV